MINVPTLEWTVAHSCNFTCESCGSFSNYGRKETMSIDDLEKGFALWNKKIAPREMAIVGGEPFLNKDILGIIELSRNMWNKEQNQYFEVVTNGFLIDKFFDLPKVLEKTNCVLNISVHGDSPQYVKKLNKVKELVSEWIKEFDITVKFVSYDTVWTRGYLGYGKNALPYAGNDPENSWKYCPAGQNGFTLLNGNIYKCAPLAHLPLMKEIFPDLSDKWNHYLSYKPLTPAATVEEIVKFYEKQAESFCEMCPSQPNFFKKNNPLMPIKFYNLSVQK